MLKFDATVFLGWVTNRSVRRTRFSLWSKKDDVFAEVSGSQLSEEDKQKVFDISRTYNTVTINYNSFSNYVARRFG